MNHNAFTLAFALCFGGSILSMLLCIFPDSLKDLFSSVELHVSSGMVQDLGQVRQGTSKTVEFTLSNRDSGPIRILDVGTSCGCTSSELSREKIERGESAVLALTYHSNQYRGPINVRAIVLYKRDDEGKANSIVLRAQGHIDPDYDVKPERLEFEEGCPSIRRVDLRPRHIPRLKVHKAVCDKRFFTAEVVPARKSGEQAVEISFDPTGYYSDAGPAHVAIHTDSERQPIVMVPLDVIFANDLLSNVRK